KGGDPGKMRNEIFTSMDTDRCFGEQTKLGKDTMPKAAQHILVCKQNSHWLYGSHDRDHALLQGDSEQWFAWLADHTSFSFQGLHGHLNMLKEARKSGGKSEDGYWYAYRRLGKRTLKKYAGRTADLT